MSGSDKRKIELVKVAQNTHLYWCVCKTTDGYTNCLAETVLTHTY